MTTVLSKEEIVKKLEEKALKAVKADNPFSTARMLGYIEALNDTYLLSESETSDLEVALLLDLMFYSLEK